MKTNQLLSKALSAVMFAGALLSASSVFAQVKIGDNPITINAGSALEIESTNKGLLMPRISLTTTTTWGLAGTAVAGMHVYNTNTGITSSNLLYPTLAAKKGEYYWDGTGWVALAPATKTTALTSFSQTTPGVVINIPTGAGGSYGAYPQVGTGIPAYLTDIKRNASFTTNTSTNDVVVDLTGLATIGGNTSQIQYVIFLYIDKTTPGTYEVVDSYFVNHTATACGGAYLNFKTALKDLPARTYNIKVYQMNWYNPGTPAVLGIGSTVSSGGCGANDFANQKLVVSVSQ